MDNELCWGPVLVIKGKYKGRIGCYDDEDGAYGYIYWGNMVSTLDSCTRIKLSSIREANTQDMARRLDELGTKIGKIRCFMQYDNNPIKQYAQLTDYYGEYFYISEILNNKYIDTFYHKRLGEKKFFCRILLARSPLPYA